MLQITERWINYKSHCNTASIMMFLTLYFVSFVTQLSLWPLWAFSTSLLFTTSSMLSSLMECFFSAASGLRDTCRLQLLLFTLCLDPAVLDTWTCITLARMAASCSWVGHPMMVCWSAH